MSYRRRAYLLTSALSVAGLILSPLQGAWAQTGYFTPDTGAAAPPAGQYATTIQAGDPPVRVGRLGFTQGTVSFHGADETQWTPATRNFPVSDGNAFWTEAGALARIDVDASAIWVAGTTEFDVNHLDIHALQGTEPQGETYLHLRALGQGDTMVVQTPRGAVTMAVNGRYEIAAGDVDHPTAITVLDGTAQVSGPGVSLTIGANQTASITGTQSFSGTVGAARQDAFLTAMLARERPPASGGPPVLQQMTGGEDLGGYGAWQSVPDYGQVWYPQVDPGWVPYRDGHWAFVAPWGWTWVDDAAWGFAPFHYGRWVQANDRWGWLPEPLGEPGFGAPGYRQPGYAPALVTFLGIGAGVALGAALAHGNVGWVPLGPREGYLPPYRASDNYLRRLNGPSINVGTLRQTTNNVTINNFTNRGGATFVPAAAMLGSRPVNQARTSVAAGDIAQYRPIAGRPVLTPAATTAGVTPAVARDMHFAEPLQRSGAPGPVVDPGVFRGALGRPGGGLPQLRPTGGAAVPGTVARPDLGRPDLGRPDLARPDLGRPDLGRPDLARPAQAPTNGARPDLLGGSHQDLLGGRPTEQAPNGGRPETARPGFARPDLARPDQARPDLGRPDLGRPDLVRPDLARPDLARPDLARPGAMPGVPALRPEGAVPNNAPVVQRPGQPEVNRPGTPQVIGPGRPGAPEAPRAPEVSRPAGSFHPAEPPRVETPRQEPPRVAAPERAAPAPAPASRPEPRPEPRAEPRPEPRVEVPHNEPRAAPPVPRPEPAQPRPAPPQSRPAPAPAARPEPSRPAPHGGGERQDEHR